MIRTFLVGTLLVAMFLGSVAAQQRGMHRMVAEVAYADSEVVVVRQRIERPSYMRIRQRNVRLLRREERLVAYRWETKNPGIRTGQWIWLEEREGVVMWAVPLQIVAAPR